MLGHVTTWNVKETVNYLPCCQGRKTVTLTYRQNYPINMFRFPN